MSYHQYFECQNAKVKSPGMLVNMCFLTFYYQSLPAKRRVTRWDAAAQFWPPVTSVMCNVIVVLYSIGSSEVER